VGELSLLRRAPRSATVTAATDCAYLAGGWPALGVLLDIPAVRQRVRRLAGQRRAEGVRPLPARLRDGYPVLLRPLLPDDRQAVRDALTGLSAESIRRRFFSSVPPTPALVDHLVDLDYVDHFAWAVVDSASHDGIAVGRYVRTDHDSPAEMAFTTVERFWGRGVATLLLGALGATAQAAGIAGLRAVTLQENVAMRAVFAKAAATSRFGEPGVIEVEVDPERAAGLLKPDLRRAVAAAAHEVVTAASLALTGPPT
jgi:RimJ/RimL family protein N-acetyltransferase